jgi:hypothetical protein
MNLLLFIIVFIILTLLHSIGDFGTSNRRFGITHYSELKSKSGWKKLLTSEFVIVINPLHWIIDNSPLRTHHFHTRPIYEEDYDGLIVFDTFWRHLAKDQFLHVIANIILSLIIGNIF